MERLTGLEERSVFHKLFGVLCLTCISWQQSGDSVLTGWAVTKPDLAAPSREKQQEIRGRHLLLCCAATAAPGPGPKAGGFSLGIQLSCFPHCCAGILQNTGPEDDFFPYSFSGFSYFLMSCWAELNGAGCKFESSWVRIREGQQGRCPCGSVL